MSLNESNGPKIRERWPVEFDLMGIERDHEVRTQLKNRMLEGEKMVTPLQNNFTAGNPNYRDISKPVVQPYRYQEYPKTMYHPSQKTPRSILARQKAELNNQLHPDKPELVPDLEIVSVIVADEKEEKQMIAKGFSETPPHPYEGSPEPQKELCDFCGLPSHKGRCKKTVKGE